MKFSFYQEVEAGRFLFEFLVTAYGTQGYPGKISGPPEDSYPGEPNTVEDLEFKLISIVDEDGPLEASQVYLNEDEFKWVFGDQELARIEDEAYYEFDGALEAVYEEAWERRDARFGLRSYESYED